MSKRILSRWILGLCALVFGASLVVEHAEAARLGGARSSGVQRSVTPPSKPAQQQAAPQAQKQAQPANSGSRWGGILGGLAIGGLLGYLFGGNGVLGILVLALLAFGAVVAIRALASRGAQQAPQRMQYAGMSQETVAPSPAAQAAPQGGRVRVPAGFDEAAFLKAAKLNFIRLQAANDHGRLDELREFMTDELYEELRREIHGGQHTVVGSLQADLLEIATEGDKHWASVHFSGTVQDSPGAAPAEFQEVWNLVKPAGGSSGWLLAGIQQMH
jgi:predicted lipid-binding transport protein (Tim44 family)